jgi:uncharacterized protein (TIGR04255 family)
MPEPILRNSPLSTVVCELRFDAPPLDPGQIVLLFNQLERFGLVEYTTEEGMQVALRPGHLQQVPVKRHRLEAADGSTALTLDLNTFAFQTTAYAGIDAFLASWDSVAAAVGDALGLQARTRIGLRYVNEIQLRGDGREGAAEAVNQDLLPPWGGHAHLRELSVALHELRFGQAEGELTFRHGLQRAGAGAPPVYLLDFDHYEQRLRGFDVADEVHRLRRFNTTIQDVFRWSITDEQYDAFDPEERPVA